MGRVKVGNGIAEYTRQLTQLYDVSREMIEDAVNDGAGLMADAMRAEINALPVAQTFARNGQKINTITSVQKAGLQAGFGVAPFQDRNGFYNRKLGFHGYNGQKSTKYPNGQPNAVIARSLVSGNSFRQKNDFVGRAVRRTQKQAEQAMQKKLESEIQKVMK